LSDFERSVQAAGSQEPEKAYPGQGLIITFRNNDEAGKQGTARRPHHRVISPVTGNTVRLKGKKIFPRYWIMAAGGTSAEWNMSENRSCLLVSVADARTRNHAKIARIQLQKEDRIFFP